MASGLEDTQWFKRRCVLHNTDKKRLRGLEKFLENSEQLLSAMSGQRVPLGAPAATQGQQKDRGSHCARGHACSWEAWKMGKHWPQAGGCGEQTGMLSAQQSLPLKHAASIQSAYRNTQHMATPLFSACIVLR